MMDKMLEWDRDGDLQAYLDDILIANSWWNEHWVALGKLFCMLTKANLKEKT